MRIKRLFVFAGFMIMAPTTWAACQNSGLKNQLTLELEPTKILLRHDLTYAEIQKESNIPIPQGMPKDSFVGGFTRTSTASKIKLDLHSKPTQGGICTAASVHLTISEPTATVFMPKDEPKNSCTYQVTHRHEMQHVAIFQRGLRRVMQTEGMKLKRIFAETLPMKHANEAAAQAYYQKVMEALNQRLERALVLENEAQKMLDTPENYRLEAQRVALCEARRRPPAEAVSAIVENLPQHPTNPEPLPDPILRGKRAEDWQKQQAAIRAERLKMQGNP